MKISILNISFVAFLSSFVLVNCHKKEETTPAKEETPSSTVTCFNSQYNGTYVGSGFTSVGTYTHGTLTINKVGCQTIDIDLYTNTAGGVTTQATQLTLNSSSAYDGKLSNGNNITVTPGGNNNMQVNAVGSFTFNGTK